MIGKLPFRDYMMDEETKAVILGYSGKRPIRGYFNPNRIDRSTTPSQYYIYEIREYQGKPVCVEERVGNGFMGTFISKSKVRLSKKNTIPHKDITGNFDWVEDDDFTEEERLDVINEKRHWYKSTFTEDLGNHGYKTDSVMGVI